MTRPLERSFSRRGILWVVGLAGVSFVLAFVLSGFADNLGEPVSADADSFSRSALGHRGLAELLEDGGLDVRRRLTARAPALDEAMVVLLAEPRPTDDEAPLGDMALAAYLDDAEVLVVPPKRQGIADPANQRWVARVFELDLDASMEAISVLAPPHVRLVQPPGAGSFACDASWGEQLQVELQSPRLLEPAVGLDAVVSCPGGILVARVTGEELWDNVVILSDPDVLNNLGLDAADNARLVNELLTREMNARSVVFDETIHGHTRNSGLMPELLRFPLVFAVIHGCMVLGLVVWSGIGRFGKPVRAAPPALDGKQALIESTSQLLRISGRPADLLRDYFRQTVRAAAEHFNLAPDLPEDRMVERLARIGRVRETDEDISQLGRDVERLARSRPTRADSSIRLARRLYAWREEIMHVA